MEKRERRRKGGGGGDGRGRSGSGAKFCKKRRLTFCLRARHGVPLSELSTLSRHSVFVQWRARASTRSTPFQTPSPVNPRLILFSSPSFRRLAAGPVLSGLVPTPVEPFRMPQHQPFYKTRLASRHLPRVRLPPLSPDKVKSYGSVKAILFLPSSIYLSLSQCSLFHATTACFSGFSWTRRTAQRREHAKA